MLPAASGAARRRLAAATAARFGRSTKNPAAAPDDWGTGDDPDRIAAEENKDWSFDQYKNRPGAVVSPVSQVANGWPFEWTISSTSDSFEPVDESFADGQDDDWGNAVEEIANWLTRNPNAEVAELA